MAARRKRQQRNVAASAANQRRRGEHQRSESVISGISGEAYISESI